MAKRHCSMTAEEVLERWDDVDDDLEMASLDGMSDDDPSMSDEEQDEFMELDDPNEPIMEGSDDDFSDLGEVDLEEVEENDDNDPCYSGIDTGSPPGSPPATTPATTPDITPLTPTSWSRTLKPVTIKSFTSPVGPTVPISASPLEVFELFFSPDLMKEIVAESNRYANDTMGEEKFQEWTTMTVNELKAFLGFLILMAINHLPSLNDYWSRDPLLHYSPIADRIPRDRFRELSRYLHFVDNASLPPRESPDYDRLGKVRPLINHLSHKFQSLYQPNMEVAVDEAMIKFQGRSSLKQYMPLKPIKRGIKVWVLADSHNGYFSEFEIYTGKKGNSPEKDLGARVVKTLTASLKGKNHHVFFDNFFTNERLVQDLLENAIYSCGTARKDRKGFPSDLKDVKLSNRYITLLVTPGGGGGGGGGCVNNYYTPGKNCAV